MRQGNNTLELQQGKCELGIRNIIIMYHRPYGGCGICITEGFSELTG